MEEENIEKQQEADVAAVKAEQYNKPKDVRLPLPGSLQEAVQIAQESDLVRKYVPGTCLRAYTRRTSR